MNGFLNKILNQIEGYLEIERKMGIDCFYGEDDSLEVKKRKELLIKISEEIKNCKKCSLYKLRRNPVSGEGNPEAKIIFLGEAPGEEEDREGRPFVGRAGELLTQIIEAMGLKRKEVYITNVLKCRPPFNRSPLLEEIKACFGYLRRQIDIVNPKIICALGRFANLALAKKDMAILKEHGKIYLYEGIKVIPTFHPAYLLRNPSEKKSAWQDFKKAIQILRE